MAKFSDRIVHAWNAFMNKDPTIYNDGPGYSYRPDRIRYTRGNERSIVTAVINRIAVDAASIDISHVKLDDNGRYVEDIDSSLNYCLKTEANIDQTGRSFRQDIFASLLDEGHVAIVPTDTTISPRITDSYKIDEMRVGRVDEWRPQTVRVEVYNARTGRKEEVTLLKKMVGLVENPFFAVMNEPNSTAKRLNRKLVLLDAVDEQSGSGKLDLIIQLPYTIKSEARRSQAERRRKDIENQLKDSKYGIAYTDATEHITQLNRAVENNLMAQVEYLTSMLYSQLGITKEILDGTADEKTMLNYYSRTIEPLLGAVVDEMKRKFLTKTARTQKQSIEFYRDPFKLVPLSQMAEITDKFTRNEVLSSNEIRQIIGMKPSKDPKADQLVNSNISQPQMLPENQNGMSEEEYNSHMSELNSLDNNLDDLESQLGGG